MKKLSAILAIAATLFALGCDSKTEYGSCIGINDDRDPALHYKVSTNNVIWGIVFFETAVVPAVVVLDEIYCPVGPAKAVQQ